MSDHRRLEAKSFPKLGGAAGSSHEHGLCSMRAWSWFAGEGHVNEPECACYVLIAYPAGIKDRLSSDERQKFRSVIARLAGTCSRPHRQIRSEYIIRRTAHEIVAPLFEQHRPERAKAIREAQSMTDVRSACGAARSDAGSETAANAARTLRYAAHYAHFYAGAGNGAFGIAARAAQEAVHDVTAVGSTVRDILAGALALGPNGT